MVGWLGRSVRGDKGRNEGMIVEQTLFEDAEVSIQHSNHADTALGLSCECADCNWAICERCNGMVARQFMIRQ